MSDERKIIEGFSPEAMAICDRSLELARRQNAQFATTNFLALALLERPEIRGVFAQYLDMSKFEEELNFVIERENPTARAVARPPKRNLLNFFREAKPFPKTQESTPVEGEIGLSLAYATLLRDRFKYLKDYDLVELEAADLAVLLVDSHSGVAVSFIRDQKIDLDRMRFDFREVRRTEKDRTKEKLAGFTDTQ